MRSITSLALLLVLLSCSDGNQREQSRDLREFAELESALSAVSSSPPEERARRLKDVEALSPENQRIDRVRARCVEGYRAFLDANEQMVEARQQVRRIEAEASKALAGPVDLDASVGALVELHAAAVSATEKLDRDLSRAEELVRECTELRAALAAELSSE